MCIVTHCCLCSFPFLRFDSTTAYLSCTPADCADGAAPGRTPRLWAHPDLRGTPRSRAQAALGRTPMSQAQSDLGRTLRSPAQATGWLSSPGQGCTPTSSHPRRLTPSPALDFQNFLLLRSVILRGLEKKRLSTQSILLSARAVLPPQKCPLGRFTKPR